jgi:DME family drug/metabolite transporter
MTHTRAILTVLTGAFFMSLAALCVRLIEQADGYQILTYRGLSQCMMIALIASITRRINILTFIKGFDATDLKIGILMAIAFCFYIFALLNTSVASALFILSIAPIAASLLSWIFLNEPPSKIAMFAIALAMIGVAIMMGAGITQGRTLGNIYAAISAVAFAGMLTMARKSKKTDVLSGNFLGALLSLITAGTLALLLSDTGLFVAQYDLFVMLGMGAFTIGIGISLVAWAAPYLPAPEVSLLVLFESVLSPIWVWIFLNEAMFFNEIIGGGFIIGAVAMLSLVRRARLR